MGRRLAILLSGLLAVSSIEAPGPGEGFLGVHPVASQEPEAEARAVRLEGHGLTVDVPASWRAMPPHVLGSLADTVSTVTGRPVQYATGFQIGSFSGWLQYPYALVQVVDVGRPVEAEAVLEMWKARGGRIVRSTTSRIDSSGVMRDMEVGELVWNEPDGVLWMPIASTVTNVGRVHGLSGWRPYERGLLMIHVYEAATRDLERLRPLVREVLRSGELDPSFANRDQSEN